MHTPHVSTDEEIKLQLLAVVSQISFPSSGERNLKVGDVCLCTNKWNQNQEVVASVSLVARLFSSATTDSG